MYSEYVERIKNEIGWEDSTPGQRNLASSYIVSVRNGWEDLVVFESFTVDEADDFYKEMRAAGFTRMFYASNFSNYLDSLLALQKAGAKMAGMVELDNPKYWMDIKKWGYSLENKTIPAIKWFI